MEERKEEKKSRETSDIAVSVRLESLEKGQTGTPAVRGR
jgi:hypothetical protein